MSIMSLEGKVVGFLLVLLIVALVLSFLLISGLVWVACWAFSLQFSWAYPVGIWAVAVIIKWFSR